MKISDPHPLSITVRHGRGVSDLFSDLRPGDKITARIIKSDGNTALLQFRGRRITADFISGVPPGGAVDLVLSEKTPDRISFTVAGRPVPDEFMKLLLSMSLLQAKSLEDFPLHNLMKFLGNGKIDLLSLNLFLAGIKRDEKGGKSAAELFNSLLNKGISYSILSDLSLILAGRGGAALLAAYYSAANGGRVSGGWRDENPEDRVDDICGALSEDDEALTVIIGLITGGERDGPLYGDIPLPDGESFSRLQYIKHQGAFFFDMEFSALGRISASVRGESDETFISIFSDNDDIIAFCRERTDILKRNLELVNVKKPCIMLHNSKKMIDKLEIWRTDFYIKREFDVRI